jgi:hypothetical protein
MLCSESEPENPGEDEQGNDRKWSRILALIGKLSGLLLAVAAVVSACNGNGPI